MISSSINKDFIEKDAFDNIKRLASFPPAEELIVEGFIRYYVDEHQTTQAGKYKVEVDFEGQNPILSRYEEVFKEEFIINDKSVGFLPRSIRLFSYKETRAYDTCLVTDATYSLVEVIASQKQVRLHYQNQDVTITFQEVYLNPVTDLCSLFFTYEPLYRIELHTTPSEDVLKGLTQHIIPRCYLADDTKAKPKTMDRAHQAPV